MLVFETPLASNAGGVITQVFDQTMANFVGWADLAVLWDEFRVLAFQAEFFPSNRYSKVAAACVPGYAVIDRDSNGALTSAGAALGYASVRIMNLEDPWTDLVEYRGSSIPALKWNMEGGVQESGWSTTAAPPAATRGAIKLWFSGLSASTSYGIALQRMLVQFKGAI